MPDCFSPQECPNYLRNWGCEGIGSAEDSLRKRGDMLVATQDQNALFENLGRLPASRAKQPEGFDNKHVQSRRKMLKMSQRWLAQTIGTPT